MKSAYNASWTNGRSYLIQKSFQILGQENQKFLSSRIIFINKTKLNQTLSKAMISVAVYKLSSLPNATKLKSSKPEKSVNFNIVAAVCYQSPENIL